MMNHDVVEELVEVKKIEGGEDMDEHVIDSDEQDLLDRVTANEKKGGECETLEDVINEVTSEVNADRFREYAWWVSLPKKERFKVGDIIYNTELDRFGIFTQPARKEGLVRVRLFKLGSKVEVYTRDWFVDFDAVVLVKRGKRVKRGFVETPFEFLRRPGRIMKREEVEVLEEA